MRIIQITAPTSPVYAGRDGPAAVAPTITSHPSNQSIADGGNATFSVVATGTGPLTYQWRRGGSPISGAVASSYAMNAAVLADSGAVFSVVVSGPGGSVTSNNATLTVVQAGNGVAPFTAAAEFPTPEQISIYAPLTRAVAAGTRVNAHYRPASSSGAWIEAHPLSRADLEYVSHEATGHPTVENFAGVIFDLSPGQSYSVRLTCVEPGQEDAVTTITASTRALPPAAGATTHTAAPGDNLTNKIDAMPAGGVLTLADGVYRGDWYTYGNGATAEAPVYVRGTSREGTILRAPTEGTRVLDLRGLSHTIFENLTIECDGPNCYQGVRFFDGSGNQINVTFRNCKFIAPVAISGTVETTGLLVYNCEFDGGNDWTNVNTNASWNAHGVQIAGTGHCVWNNTFKGHGDCFHHAEYAFTASNFFWRNRILWTGDDVGEFDFVDRNSAIYGNYVTNCSTVMSIDYVGAGPFYFFHNTIVNFAKGPFKLNSKAASFYIYNNTLVKHDGFSGYGMYVSSGGPWHRNYSFRNNIFIARKLSETTVLRIDSGLHDPVDWDHNAYYPASGGFGFSENFAVSPLSSAQAAQPNTTPVFGTATKRLQDDIGIPSNPFVTDVTVNESIFVKTTDTHTLTLAQGSAARNAGVHIPGITNGYSGAAPDIGAVITGRSVPAIGYIAPATPGAWPAWRVGMVPFERKLISNRFDTVGHIGLFNAWCGMAALDGVLYIPGTGGHADSGQNGCFACDLGADSPIWVQESVGSPGSAWVTNSRYYTDGRPTSAHTYYALQGIASRGKIFRFSGGAVYGDGNFSSDATDAWSPITKDWDAAGSHPDTLGGGTGACMAQDYTTGDVYTLAGRWHHDTDTWTADPPGVNYEERGGYYRASCFDSVRQRYVVFSAAYGFANNAVYLRAKSTGAWTRQYDIPDGYVTAQHLSSDTQNFAWHDPVLDKIYMQRLNGELLEIDPVTFANTLKTTTGTMVPAINVEASDGVLGKVVPMPELGGVAYMPHARTGVWFLATE